MAFELKLYNIIGDGSTNDKNVRPKQAYLTFHNSIQLILKFGQSFFAK